MFRGKLSGNALKLIALVSMLIDHFCVVFYTGSRLAGRELFSRSVYWVFRSLGRPAFPIFCFLLAEGYRHTRDVKKYLLRLLCFAVLSELPFDIALYRSWFTLPHQNVGFTLLLGLLGILLWDRITEYDAKNSCFPRQMLGLAAIGCMALAARYLHTDYGMWGVMTIAALHLFRESEWQRDLFSGCALILASPLEAFSFVDYFLFHLYNGKRGRQIGYLFYVFYPAHLLLLALLRRLIYGI